MQVDLLNIDQLVTSGFEDLPLKLYDQEFIGLISNKINASYFNTAFLIPEKGRVVLYNNPNLYYEGERALALGHFECMNDPEVAKALFKAVESKAKEMGINFIIGPMNGSTWDSYRFSLEHNTPTFFLEPYHHLYYNELWKECGFDIIANYRSSMDKTMGLSDPKDLQEINLALDKNGVVVRSIDLDNYESEIAKVHGFCEAIFQKNFLYTPTPENEFIQKYLPLKQFLQPEYVLMAENAEKDLIAIFFSVTDIYNRAVPTLIVKTIARHPGSQYAGVIQNMANKVIEAAKQNGYKQMIHAFMHHDNRSNNVSRNFSGEVFRSYALYGKKVV